MEALTHEQEMLVNHSWTNQLREWLKDNHKSQYRQMKKDGELIPWTTKKVEKALWWKEKWVKEDNLHPSQAEELARDLMFSL